MFRIAHLSDIHVFAAMNYMSSSILLSPKRLTGLANILWRRGPDVYSFKVLQQAFQDIQNQRVDHLVITGDITNIAMEEEFQKAASLIREISGKIPTSIIPGNHDIYTFGCPKRKLFQKYFGENIISDLPSTTNSTGFPFVKQIKDKNINIIGLNSAVPRLPLVASGFVSQDQLESLEQILQQLKGGFNIILIHHPPIARYKGFNEFRQGLRNKDALIKLLSKYHVNMVLHGHTHKRYQGNLNDTQIFEAGSGTYLGEKKNLRATYNIYEIRDQKLNNFISRRINETTFQFETLKE